MRTLLQLIQKTIHLCLTNAAVAMVAIIVAVEFFLHPYLTHNYFSHEVDRKLQDLERPSREFSIVAIGDSVGHGIFEGWNFNTGRLASLACNQATETAGQYFFLKRFLKKNKAPGAVISCDRTPLSGNLNQDLTENYVQRCFTEWSEILELMLVKLDPVFTVKMVAYKFLATFKYRLHLQKEIVGFTNSDIYSGVVANSSTKKANYGIIRMLSELIGRQRSENISTHFFKKMLADLEKINVAMYYLPPPSRLDNKETHELILHSIENMEGIKNELGNVQVIKDQYRRMPGQYFHDEVHLNEAGLKAYRSPLQANLEILLTDALQRQEDNLSRLFTLGDTISAFSNFGSGVTFPPLNDAKIEAIDGKLVILSMGNDPSLLLPAITSIKRKKEYRVAIRVLLKSTVPTEAQVFYTFGMKPNFTEENSLKQTVKIGRNTLLFVMPEDFSEGKLRFDPGKCVGTFVVEQLEAKIVDVKILDLI